MATPATVAYVMQQIFQLGIPLTRQSKYLKELGAEIGSNTLANRVIKSSRWFDKLWRRMHELLLKESVIHADETPLRGLNSVCLNLPNKPPTPDKKQLFKSKHGIISARKISLTDQKACTWRKYGYV